MFRLVHEPNYLGLSALVREVTVPVRHTHLREPRHRFTLYHTLSVCAEMRARLCLCAQTRTGALPGRFHLVFVDGWHTFDYTLLDLFFADLLTEVSWRGWREGGWAPRKAGAIRQKYDKEREEGGTL